MKYSLLFLCLVHCIGLVSQEIFKDISSNAGVNFAGQNIGVAFSDYDQDGDQDAYISVRNGPNRLLQNQGNNRFLDVAQTAKVSNAGNSRTSVFGDFNNDGWPDLYVGNFDEADVLYLNQGDGTFLDITTQAGIDNPARSFSVNLADVDQDGLLDIYIANFQQQNILYRNLGNLQFEDITIYSRAVSTYNAMGALFFDYDRDGDQDLYLTHDGQPNILYQNMGNGRFFDASRRAKVDYHGFGMGVDAADINRDGWMDLYITNLYENVLFINNKNGTFTNYSKEAAIDDYGMAWGTNFFDYDNDGWTDLYVTNDSYFSPYPNVLYKNNGNKSFSVMSSNQAVASMQAGYGSATADIDQDGKLDLLVANAASKDNLQLFHNQTEAGNWISIDLEGIESNRSAIGARIEFWDHQGFYHQDEVHAGSGYASQNGKQLHFGLGTADRIDSLIIHWPNGLLQTVEQLSVNQFYKIIEGQMPEALQLTTSLIKKKASVNFINTQPNPTNSEVQISWELPENKQVPNWLKIYDYRGELIWQQELNQTSSKSFVWNLQARDGTMIPNGLYLIQLINEVQLIGVGKLLVLK